MLKPISKWIVNINKSYINLEFEFATAEGATDFYEMFLASLVEDKEREVIANIYAVIEKEDK